MTLYFPSPKRASSSSDTFFTRASFTSKNFFIIIVTRDYRAENAVFFWEERAAGSRGVIDSKWPPGGLAQVAGARSAHLGVLDLPVEWLV